MCKYRVGYGRLAEDEYMIVGTKEGLEYLIQSCEEAINHGQSKAQKDCEIYAVKKVDSEYFIDEKKQNLLNHFMGLISGLIFGGVFFSSLIIGFVTIIKWLFI